ncbi:hypothetical protein LCI18_011760 [Fusarium solani-melongenae]|uniref:Uncharacterized protein n=1 Tax=Fusarium solani subsp. cucurbitae TaxID=2747967 RepID=A0ACD3ZI94_FUSSC|nr:hypothetical protein LCI18_011760 [Fusarium solani-melongenae]
METLLLTDKLYRDEFEDMFIAEEISRLKTDYLADEDEDSERDDEGLGGDNAGSDAGFKGWTEISPEIMKRVQKLVDANEEFEQNSWADPFDWD